MLPPIMPHQRRPLPRRPRRAGAGVGLLSTWIAVRIAARRCRRMEGRARASARTRRAPMNTHPPRSPRPPPPSTRCSSASPSTSPSAPVFQQRSPRPADADHPPAPAPEMVDDGACARASVRPRRHAGLGRGPSPRAAWTDAVPAQTIELGPLQALAGRGRARHGWIGAYPRTRRAASSGNPSALRRALWNLVENAVKFGYEVEWRWPAVAGEALGDPRPATTALARGGRGSRRCSRPFYYRTEVFAQPPLETGRDRGLRAGDQLATCCTPRAARSALRNHPEGGLEARSCGAHAVAPASASAWKVAKLGRAAARSSPVRRDDVRPPWRHRRGPPRHRGKTRGCEHVPMESEVPRACTCSPRQAATAGRKPRRAASPRRRPPPRHLRNCRHAAVESSVAVGGTAPPVRRRPGIHRLSATGAIGRPFAAEHAGPCAETSTRCSREIRLLTSHRLHPRRGPQADRRRCAPPRAPAAAAASARGGEPGTRPPRPPGSSEAPPACRRLQWCQVVPISAFPHQGES